MMKIKPVIKEPKNYVNYTDLDIKDCFIQDGELYMKCGDTYDYEQCAINLSTGHFWKDMCGELVLPVDTVINWTKQKE